MIRKLFGLAAILFICSSFQKKLPKPRIPACIQQKIKAFKKMEKYAQPRNVYEYSYRGQKVYYISMPCCDNFNELYDSNCKLMGHPDGGFTGKGDGKLPDFNAAKKGEKLIWKND
jgi:hypothetical protein